MFEDVERPLDQLKSLLISTLQVVSDEVLGFTHCTFLSSNTLLDLLYNLLVIF